MPDDPLVERSSEVFGLLARFVHRSDQEATSDLRRHGLTPAQFQLLRAVSRRPGALQREFGEHFAVTGANVSMLIDKLERAGLLRREPVGAANRVWTTEAGTELLARLEPELEAFFRTRFAGLAPAELEQLGALMSSALEGLPGAR